MQTTTIAKKEQENMLSSFWTMLRECESKVDNADSKDPVLKLWVEQWYGQWNRVTGDTKEPVWVTRERNLGLSSTSETTPGL